MPTRVSSARTNWNSSVSARFQHLVDKLPRRVAVLAIFGRGQLHQDVPGASFGSRAAIFQLHQLGVFEADAKGLRQIAREVIAANAHAGGELHRVAIVNDHLGGFSADIDHRYAFPAILRKRHGIAGGEGFENRFLNGKMRLIHRANQRTVLLYRSGQQVYD